MTNDEAWAGDRVARWLRQTTSLEPQRAPVSEVLFEAAALRPGERVLDVGCGTGPTTRRAAREVGRAGRVIGLDISAELLAAAAAEPGEDGAAPLEWVTADAVTWQPGGLTVDVVISRFGVMFFSDPTAAFATLAAATRPGGRLAMAVWGRRDETELFAVPMRAVLDALCRRGTPVEVPPGDGGPFSLHDPAVVTALLAGAGWSDIRCTPRRLMLPFGEGMAPAAAAAVVLEFGPVRPVAAQLGDDERAAVAKAVTAALAEHRNHDGRIELGARILLVTANRP